MATLCESSKKEQNGVLSPKGTIEHKGSLWRDVEPWMGDHQKGLLSTILYVWGPNVLKKWTPVWLVNAESTRKKEDKFLETYGITNNLSNFF